MLSLSRWLPRLGRVRKPLDFSNVRFPQIPPSRLIEEETLPDYVASLFYPARIGEILEGQYQIVGKLGFGVTSTVWLARDLNHRRHVALKLFINSRMMGDQLDNELNIYKRIESGPKDHPGYGAVRTLVDSFDVDGPDGKHRCLVHPPLFESALTLFQRSLEGRLPIRTVAFVLKRLFLALDYLHTGCKIIHTDIKADNIMFNIDDDAVFSDFELQELEDPLPRKETEDRTIYQSRQVKVPKELGAPVLCDFGSAVAGDVKHTEDVQPDIYRAPEVILEVPWAHEIDIWNTGCMVWDMFEGGNLFTGQDPEHNSYRSRAHISEMIALLGPPPRHLLEQGNLSSNFFGNDGSFTGGIPIPDQKSLEHIETSLDGLEKVKFLNFMRKMLQWEPSKRSSARDLAEDEWIQANIKDS